MNNISNCKGCLTVRCRHIENVGYKTETGMIECPCTICLIKVVCVIACDSYTVFKTDANAYMVKKASDTIAYHLKKGMDLFGRVHKNGKL